MADLISTNNSRIHNLLEYSRTSASIIHGRLGPVYSKHATFTVAISIFFAYMMLLTCLRFIMIIHAIGIKIKRRLTSNSRDLDKVAILQAYVMPHILTKWKFHGPFGYGCTIKVFKVGGTALSLPSTSHLLVRINTQAKLHTIFNLCSK